MPGKDESRTVDSICVTGEDKAIVKSHIRKRHAPWPDEPLIPAHLDRERNRRWAEHCGIVKQKGTCLVHCSTMELRTHVCRVKRELRPPMNGVLPGLGSAITYWEGDYFFLTRYLI